MSSPSRLIVRFALSLLGVGVGLDSASAQRIDIVNPGGSQPANSGYAPGASPYASPGVPHPSGSAYTPYGPGYGYGYGYQPQILTGRGSTLQGAASLTAATGQYYQDIQQASGQREQNRQASYETTRKRLQLELDYEDMQRQRYRRTLDYNRQFALDRARTNPFENEIWSGSTLNVLLKSILASPAPARGPNIPLSQDTLSGINLTDGVSQGSLAMAKDEGRIEWTDALQDSAFDTPRKRFAENYAAAMKAARTGEKSARSTLKDLEIDLKTLGGMLDDQVATLSPSDYTGSRRLLNKLKDGVKGLSSARVLASYDRSWRQDVRTVADLVAYCQQKGVQFGAAAALGDKQRYQAAYQAVRAYERGTSQLASAR